jgi:hypothetical protein
VALGRYVITASYTTAAGTPATATAGEPGTGGAAGYGTGDVSAGYSLYPQTFLPGTALWLDSAGPLYAVLNGASVLRAFVDGQDDVGHAALSN